MRILKATLLGLFCSSMAFGQTTTMNVYQSNGVLLQLPVSAIDSITLSTTPTPSMSIYQTGGSVSTIVLANIDSITYTVVGTNANLPILTTLPVSNITAASATSGGNITSDGGAPVTQRGVVWSTSTNPTLSNNSTSDGSGTGSFTSDLTGLISNTMYYVRAYATNSAGTAYGNEVTFTTTGGIVSNPGGGVTFDGYTYTSVVLGNGQEWMAENLRTTTYANGDPIPNVTDLAQWLNLTTGAWVHYNNDSQYENPYGKLYNWYTVSDPSNVCPTGWHVPTDAEWNTLIGYLDPSYIPNATESQSITAGGKMKSTGTQYWSSPNVGATNESGFSGFPGGLFSGPFSWLGTSGHWWSSTENSNSADGAWMRSLGSHYGDVSRNSLNKQYGLSIRCIKDQ